MAVGSKIKNPRRIFSQDGFSASTDTRIYNLENNVYKITYYEIISGTSGSISVPSGATINQGEFGLSGNAILSKIDGSNKVTYESPLTSSGLAVTATLDSITGAWLTSGVYTDTFVALIYSINIKGKDYQNLNNAFIIETVSLNSVNSGAGGINNATASGTDTYTATISGVTSYAEGDAYLIRFTNGNTTVCSLNINSLGAINLYRNNDGALIGGDIQANGEMLCVYNSSANTFQCIGTSPNSLISYVTNDDSVTLTKGMPVYAFSGIGDRLTVKRAYNTLDSTSAQTIGLVMSTSIAANQKGFIMMQGLLDGLSILPTSTWTDGSPVYLGATAGTITNVKPYAPNHLVYLGFVTTASNGSAGRLYIRVQNGYELDELHNVQAQSPTLKDTLWYDDTVSPTQWKTASIPTILGFTPENVANKATTMTGNTASNTLYLTAKAIFDWATGLFVQTTRSLTVNGTTSDLSADRTFTVTDANLSTSDITTNNVSTTKHGFAPKLPNDATKYLDGTGAYSVPAGGGGSGADEDLFYISSFKTLYNY